MPSYTPSPLDDEVRKLNAQGLNLRQIARAVKSNSGAVRLILLNLRLKWNKDKSVRPEEFEEIARLTEEGMSVSKIAAEMQLGYSRVAEYVATLDLSPAQDYAEQKKAKRLSEIRTLHEQGMTASEIKAKLGISRHTYSVYAAELGIGAVRVKVDFDEVMRLHRSGMDVESIADELGVLPHRVEVAIQNEMSSAQKQHGIIGGVMVDSGCECELCSRARQVIYDRTREMNQETVKKAGNRYREWTGPELEIVVRTDLTAKQKAEMTGRTYYSVVAALSRLRHDPHWKAALHVTPPPTKKKLKRSDIEIMLDRSLTLAEAARKVGCSTDTVTRYRSLETASKK